GGPYGFSLLDSLANASYSSTDARGRAACVPGIALRPCANASATPNLSDPRAAATVPTKLRRESAPFTSIRPLRSDTYFTRKPVDEPAKLRAERACAAKSFVAAPVNTPRVSAGRAAVSKHHVAVHPHR